MGVAAQVRIARHYVEIGAGGECERVALDNAIATLARLAPARELAA